MEAREHESGQGAARPTLEPLEQRVLELIASGLSNRQVADRLGISVGLARIQLTAIMEKLGAGSRLEAIIIALRRGLVERPSG